jgi:hypothetical protein
MWFYCQLASFCEQLTAVIGRLPITWTEDNSGDLAHKISARLSPTSYGLGENQRSHQNSMTISVTRLATKSSFWIVMSTAGATIEFVSNTQDSQTLLVVEIAE